MYCRRRNSFMVIYCSACNSVPVCVHVVFRLCTCYVKTPFSAHSQPFSVWMCSLCVQRDHWEHQAAHRHHRRTAKKWKLGGADSSHPLPQPHPPSWVALPFLSPLHHVMQNCPSGWQGYVNALALRPQTDRKASRPEQKPLAHWASHHFGLLRWGFLGIVILFDH